MRGLSLKLALGVAITAGSLFGLVAFLYVTDVALSVWSRLQQMPLWFVLVYGALVLAFAALVTRVVWRLLAPAKRSPPRKGPPTEVEVVQRLQESEAAGIDVAPVKRELDELHRRRATGEVVVAVFGQVSVGKSTLIKALVPSADIAVDVLAGTTRSVQRWTWESPAGDRLVISDLPGLDDPDAASAEAAEAAEPDPVASAARAEAMRAHIVVYVSDGDLGRAQWRELQALRAMGNPVVVAINKTDRYGDAEIEAIRARIQGYLDGSQAASEGAAEPILFEAATHVPTHVVAVSAGGAESVLKVYSDGREEWVSRTRPAHVQPLAEALQRLVDRDLSNLERLRDAAVFLLAGQVLDQALAEHRARRADEVIHGATRRAVVAAMAAVAPGLDIVVQGYLGYNMVRDLGEVYGIPVKEIDARQVTQLAAKHVGKGVPLALAVAGNVAKAFPGVGTVSGGLLHAVAYGLIFESLGKAVARTMAERGALAPVAALHRFEEVLGEDLETRAKRLVGLALATSRGERGESNGDDQRTHGA